VSSNDPTGRFEELLRQSKIQFHFPGAAKPQAEEDEPSTAGDEEFSLSFGLKPREVKRHLDRFVVGQEEAKKVLSIAVCDHYNYVKQLREGRPLTNYLKQNVLLLGPTGVGKTYLIRCLAELIGVPFVKADATKFSETGYVGQDVDELVRSLVQQANGNIQLAECGMIYLDEIDKIAGASNMGGRDVSGRGVQTNLLKLMEETEVPLRSANDIQAQMEAAMEMAQGRRSSKPRTINTRTILFIGSGAFAPLTEIVRRRLRSGSIGFNISREEHHEDEHDLLLQASTADLTQFGFEPEFAGRLPVRVACKGLTAEDLEKILTQAEGSILQQYQAAFEAYGITLKLTPEVVAWVAKEAAKEQTGARGLMSVLERLLRDLKYELPSSRLKEVEIDMAFVQDPSSALKSLLEKARKVDFDEHSHVLEEVMQSFWTKHQLRVTLSPDAMEEIVKLASLSEKPLAEFAQDQLKEFPYGLKLIAANTQQTEFILSADAVRNPHQVLSDWVLKSFQK